MTHGWLQAERDEARREVERLETENLKRFHSSTLVAAAGAAADNARAAAREEIAKHCDEEAKLSDRCAALAPTGREALVNETAARVFRDTAAHIRSGQAGAGEVKP